ncbi:MAG: hypothetical protein EB828_03620 [Nitrosopumilus sp. D6]|nr:MAG: hypothetical protein EB828_03620 [Nitrosopumilus sp. D6]
MPKRTLGATGTARAKMCRWASTRPGEFESVYGVRNKIESFFLSIKRRIDVFVRARSLPVRTVEIFTMILCHNMIV